MKTITAKRWAPSLEACAYARKRLKLLRTELRTYKARYREHHRSHSQALALNDKRVIAALRVELDHCRSLLNAPREGCWTTRVDISPNRAHSVTLFVSPKGNEYVRCADNREPPDLLIDTKVQGLPLVPLRRYNNSRLLKHLKRATKEETKRREQKAEARRSRLSAISEGASEPNERKEALDEYSSDHRYARHDKAKKENDRPAVRQLRSARHTRKSTRDQSARRKHRRRHDHTRRSKRRPL